MSNASEPTQEKANDFDGYELILECEHTVYVRVKLRKIYPDDEHYVLCQKCSYIKSRNPYNLPATGWSKVIKERGVTDEFMSNVYSASSFNLPADILRLQPSVPTHRVRPFPYVTRRIT